MDVHVALTPERTCRPPLSLVLPLAQPVELLWEPAASVTEVIRDAEAMTATDTTLPPMTAAPVVTGSTVDMRLNPGLGRDLGECEVWQRPVSRLVPLVLLLLI